MATCYQCGRKIENGEGQRREVYTGHSDWFGFSGKRLRGGDSNRYGMRLICNECATPTDGAMIISAVKFVIKVGVVTWILWKLSGCF